MDMEFRTLSEFEDQLKESIDIKETKKIKQKHWLLTQQQSDLKFQLSTHRFQLEEKIALWMLFDVRYVSSCFYCFVPKIVLIVKINSFSVFTGEWRLYRGVKSWKNDWINFTRM